MNFGHTTAGRKWWVQPVWHCNGHDKRNGSVCTSKDIRQDVLMKVTAEVLGLEEFDSDVFLERVEYIFAVEDYKLLFKMKDGTKILKTWKPKKRGPKKKSDEKRR